MNAEFERLIVEAMQAWRVPGLAIAIVTPNEVLYKNGFGWRETAKQLPVDANTIFWIGSCTKAMTAMAMGILVDEGKLGWETRVLDVLPDFKMYDEIATQHMTVFDLLCHRSGLPRHDKAWFRANVSRHDLMQRLAHLPPNKAFRATYQYQNIMYIVAGLVIERVTGTSWEAFLHERIFSPLNMNRTVCSHATAVAMGNLSEPYQERDDRVMWTDHYAEDDNALGPAGGVQSCVVDLAKWVQHNLRVANDTQTSQQLQALYKPQVAVCDETALIYGYEAFGHSNYGLGWRLNSYRGRWLVQHNGAIDGFGSHVSFMPKAGYGVAILGNLNGTNLPATLAYGAYDRLLGLPPIDWVSEFKAKIDKGKSEGNVTRKNIVAGRNTGAPSHNVADYIGAYHHPGYGTLYIEHDATSTTGVPLRMRFNNMRFTIAHQKENVFDIDTLSFDDPKTITFDENSENGARSIDRVTIQWEASVAPIAFVRIA
jgi:CubicO group peptidase (beta-lactamase class C family)